MKFTSATIILSTLSIFGASDGAGVRGKSHRGVPRQLDGDPNNTPCKEVPQGEQCEIMGHSAGCKDPAFIHDGCASPNYPVYYDQGNLTFGPGWYCNDDADVQDLMCDKAYIHTSCGGDGALVNFDIGLWRCNN